ncbi:MIP/aquaporin family protein [Candidatus Neptunochlamydia vexilliferae]|uniref:Glycerol uptake facilitator protein n=1 Tax=Candidatus Neptunichlamydia vexilliferae TaxID=1651774 RepID=A0ABS0AWU6_9BACT|nr:MIP/aquaporin family protein [Candidatus Neptunochlamydia vexilliferae]MBF5058608.1 putative glycerol uptake facilitator protein [Candidatus Neptunochlamydia vexilliferae]
MSIFWGELLGTLLLILLGDGAVANVLLKKSKGEQSGWIVITAGWGFAVAMGVYAVGWATGGHINPAVTFGFAIVGKTPWNQVPTYIAGQMVGAILGAILVWASYFLHFEKSDNKTHKLLIFCTQPAIRAKRWNFVTEVIATAVLLIGVLGIFNIHNEIASGVGPFAVGLLVFSIGLSLGGPTGYAINPARDLGPRLVHSLFPIQGKGSSDWDYAWVPIIGPLLGAALGALIYQNILSL